MEKKGSSRRDFMKQVGLMGAAGAGTLALLRTPGLCADSQRNKLVFISDLHMNNDQPYSWQRDHVGRVAAFIDEVNGRPDVAELIILGDLVDQWVFPSSQTPSTAAVSILQLDHNQPILTALQTICANTDINVTYVVGNHDLLVYTAANQADITTLIPGLTIAGAEPGLGSYSKDDVIWAEHGHRYCLFNAPDTWSYSGSHLPLGYFITRALAAMGTIDQTTSQYLDLLTQHITSNGISNVLPDLVYEAVIAYSGLSQSDAYSMNGLDGFTTDPTVTDVAAAYSDIFTQWTDRQNIVDEVTASIDDMGTLVGAANHQFTLPTQIPFTPRIIVFGHTHHAVFQHLQPSDDIYANTGTWIDGKSSTWVEITIEPSAGQKSYTVELWYYGESTPRYQGEIIV